jgi:hypothetical protein
MEAVMAETAYDAAFLHGFLTGAGLAGLVLLTGVIAITFEKKLRGK